MYIVCGAGQTARQLGSEQALEPAHAANFTPFAAPDVGGIPPVCQSGLRTQCRRCGQAARGGLCLSAVREDNAEAP